MEMIDRYVYAVTKRLPQPLREDIAEELHGLIEDMLEAHAQGSVVTEKDIETVLSELGNPRHLAEKYRGTKRYIIGPEVYDSYISVLKIIMITVTVAMGITFSVQIITDPVGILDHFVDLIVSLVIGIPQVFGWITFAFIVIEYGGFKAKNRGTSKEWNPADLPPVPDPKKQIKHREPVVGIVFFVLLIFFVAFSNHYLGVFIFKDDKLSTIIPFLNQANIEKYVPLIILFLGFSVLKECLKLITGKWTYQLVLYTAIINLASIVVVFVMITGPAFWNPDFMSELVQAGSVSKGSESYEDVQNIWQNTTLGILVVLIVGLIWDVIAGFIKSRK